MVNGLFEAVGAIATWANAYRLWRDRTVSGIHPASNSFFAAWGLWNLVYYPHLSQWVSFMGGALLVAGNLVWTYLYIRIRRTEIAQKLRGLKIRFGKA